MEEYLRNLYKEFIALDQKIFLDNTTKLSTSLSQLKLPEKVINQYFNSYYKPTFFGFLYNVKTLLHSEKVFDYILKTSTEDWKLWPYMKFLTEKGVISVGKAGEVTLLKKELLNFIPRPQSEQEIREKLGKALSLKIQDGEPVINLFKKYQEFTVKGKWDQMPISQSSAIFVTKKILSTIPFNKTFLFVGDDDFVSIILGIVDPTIESLVLDADEKLLESINILAKEFNLKIKTGKADIRKKYSFKENFVGFLTNPVYTADGAKEFIAFGKKQLGKDGGFALVEIGDESIGNQFVFLQQFFAENSMIIKELTAGKVFYPWISLYEEDKEMLGWLSQLIDKEVIEKSPKLGASLYVFECLPKKVSKVKFKKPIYAYI